MVNNPTAVRFSNERIRVAADVLCRGLAVARGILAEWDAKGMASLFPDDAGVGVADGAPADGRAPISAADVHRVIEALAALVAALEGTASNGRTHYANALRVAVNPTPRLLVEV